MMYVIYNNDGSIKSKFLNEFVEQGNNNVNELFVAIEGRENWTLYASFKLPNGSTTTVVSSTPTTEFIEGIGTFIGRKILLSNAETLVAGALQMNVVCFDENDAKLVAFNTYITVNETGIQLSDPILLTVQEYENLLVELKRKMEYPTKYVQVTALPDNPDLDTIYVLKGENDLNEVFMFNGKTESWIPLGSNRINLGNYYTKEEGEDFEEGIEERVSQVENELASVASGSPKGVYATLSDLETAYPTGTNGIYVVLADGHWYYWNTTNEEWTDGGAYFAIPDNAKYVEGSILFSGYNKTISAVNELGYGSAEIDIYIPKGAYITFKNTTNSVHNGSFTITYTDNTTLQIASNIVYGEGASFFAQKDIKSLGMYVEDYAISFELNVLPICEEMKNNIERLEGYFTPENLFNPDEVESGWIGTNDGEMHESSGVVTSDYIPIQSGKTYVLRQPLAGFYGTTGASRIPLFDENKNFVTYITGTLENDILTFTIPAVSFNYGDHGVGLYKYMRFSTAAGDEDITMCVEGNTYPNVMIPYGSKSCGENIGLGKKQKEQIAGMISVSSPLLNKKIAYNGDSICESRLNESSNAYNGGAYAKLIADIVDGTYENRAISGGILASDTPDHNPPTRRIVSDVVNMADDADLICFEGGINDYWHSVPLGTFSESDYTSEVDTTTVLGALESIIRQATNKWVGKPICFIIVHKITSTVYTQNSAGYTFEQAHNQMKALCKKYAIPVFDAFEESGLNAYNAIQNNTFLTSNVSGTPDGCHPNKAGYESYYVPQLIKFFESLIKRN